MQLKNVIPVVELVIGLFKALEQLFGSTAAADPAPGADQPAPSPAPTPAPSTTTSTNQ